MEYSNLYELIQCLEYGTNLHIGVLFFKDYGNEFCQLPFQHTIHAREVCDELKSKGKQEFKRCFRCRNLAIRKAMTTKKPFGDICVNGVYEYTHPVVLQGDVACVIYIGNILAEGKGQEKLEKQLGEKRGLIETLEERFSYQRCSTVGNLLESYIRFLLEKYGYRNRSTNPLIENIKNYLQSNLEYDISVSHITSVFHYNRQYLGRLFKKETGFSIKEYILIQRMERAKTLLENSSDTVIEIANRVGFNNVTYFNRQFKARFGVTPSQYRSGKRGKF